MRDELRDVVLHDVFLLQERFLGKGMRESPPLAGVVGVVGHGERADAYDGLNGSNVHGVFLEIWAARTVPVDVVPCLEGVEVEFCWGYPHDWAVLVVEQFVVKGDASSEKRSYPRKGRDGVQFWAREFGERIEGQTVDCLEKLFISDRREGTKRNHLLDQYHTERS